MHELSFTKGQVPLSPSSFMRVADPAAMQTLTPAGVCTSSALNTSPTTLYYRRTRRSVSEAKPLLNFVIVTWLRCGVCMSDGVGCVFSAPVAHASWYLRRFGTCIMKLSPNSELCRRYSIDELHGVDSLTARRTTLRPRYPSARQDL